MQISHHYAVFSILHITMSSDISSTTASNASFSLTPSAPSHFEAVIRTEQVETPDSSRKRRKLQYACRVCSSWSTSHRTNAVKHVSSRHALRSSSQSSPSISATQRDISTMFTPISSQSALRNSFSEQSYREAIIGLLTRRRMPFSSVEWSEMKDLALACNPAIGDLLITSRRTAVRYIASNYKLYRGQIKTSLSTSSSPIHISSDLWTSPHRHSLLAVCAQWVDQDYELQKALLALPECRFTHSGEKQASLILKALEDFNIQSKIGWHTGDNATSNDTCLVALEEQLRYKHSVGLIYCCML